MKIRNHFFISLPVVATLFVSTILVGNAYALERGTPISNEDATKNSSSSTTGATTPSDTHSTNADTASHLANIKTKGDQEIKRRLDTLNGLLSRISGTTKLTASDKASLTAEINNEISGLTALETTLNNETTITSAAQDVAAMITEYRVYALLIPKVQIIRMADDQQTIEGKLTTLQTKLAGRISVEQTAGKDVSTLTSELTAMQNATSTAQGISSQVETSVLALQPSNYDADHTILTTYHTQLSTARNDIQTAYNDGKTIASGLKTLSPND